MTFEYGKLRFQKLIVEARFDLEPRVLDQPSALRDALGQPSGFHFQPDGFGYLYENVKEELFCTVQFIGFYKEQIAKTEDAVKRAQEVLQKAISLAGIKSVARLGVRSMFLKALRKPFGEETKSMFQGFVSNAAQLAKKLPCQPIDLLFT